MNVATVRDSSVPISIVLRHSGMISVDNKKLMTDCMDPSACCDARRMLSEASELWKLLSDAAGRLVKAGYTDRDAIETKTALAEKRICPTQAG